ncbi:MAG: hypothetical protein V4760_07330 [Bdellovibrionota bacterium]
MPPRLLVFFIPVVIASLLSSCAPSSPPADGWVTMPWIYIHCQTALCNRNITPTKVYVTLTTTGCADPSPGLTRSSVMTSTLVCNTSNGCFGSVYPWLHLDGRQTTGVPPGTYSTCIRIDYNGDYPTSTSGDSYVAEVAYEITKNSTSHVIYTGWVDQ